MKKETDNIKTLVTPSEEGSTKIDESKSIFLNDGVSSRKDQAFKIKCEGAKDSTGLNSEQFFKKAEIIRQNWYTWSWGIEPFPHYIKIRLCDLFGKPFRDLFLGVEEK